jgi:hypothetical protein
MRNYEEIKSLYTAVFQGEEDSMPLIINPPCPSAPTVDELWEDLPRALEKASDSLKPKADIKSDWIPSINIGLYQCIAIPSLFGAEVIKLNGSEPICHPCFNSIEQAIDADIPELKSSVIDRMFNDIQTAQRLLSSQGYMLSFPATASPFDLAQIMAGESFLISMMSEPDKAALFLENLTELAIQLTKLVKNQMNQPDDEYITNRGLFFPGLRLPCDAIVNYSPQMIRQFVNPVLDKLGENFKNLCIHFCTEPAPSSHVLDALLGCRCVIAVDNWQGPDIFINAASKDWQRKRITIISSTDISTFEKMNNFLKKQLVQSIRKDYACAFVLATEAESVEHGIRIYEKWKQLTGPAGSIQYW